MTFAQKCLAGSVFLLMLAPLATGAATVEELRAQIEDLLRRIDTLQQQIGQGATGGSPAVVSGAASCPRVGVTLRLGSTGDDVTRLQQFLALDSTIYPERLVTGYYGGLTEAAIKRWQTRHNVVTNGTSETTGYGQYGPRTAALMALECQNGGGAVSQVGGFIKVSPISGAAPLSVTIEATVNTARSCSQATYILDYGDGTAATNIPISSGGCAEQKYVYSHTYQYGGTYPVILSAGGHKTQATVVVSGTGQSSGQNSCASDIVGAQQNAAGKVCTQVAYTLKCPHNTSYSYAAPNGCESSYLLGRSWQIKTENTAYGIMSVSADPANYLKIEVSFDVGECTAYELSWGDASASARATPSCVSNNIVTKTLTHTYAGPGTYTVKLTRANQVDVVDVVIVAD